jgi:hypothetical protein
VGCATSSDNLGCRTGYLFIQLRRGVEPGLRGVHVNMYLPGFLFKSSKSFVLFLGTLEGLTVLLCYSNVIS